ncbi:hypothetical protein D3C87_1596210 [compost metagenome]
MLGGGISRHRRRRVQTGRRRHVEHMARPAGLEHLRDEVIAAMHHPHHVDVQHPLPVGKVALQELAQVADAGVVDQHVERPERGMELLGQFPHGFAAGDIELMDGAAGTEGLDVHLHLPERNEIDVGGNDQGAPAGECQRGGATDAGSGASDQDVLVFKFGGGHGNLLGRARVQGK